MDKRVIADLRERERAAIDERRRLDAMRKVLCARMQEQCPDTFGRAAAPCDGHNVVCGWCDHTVRAQAEALTALEGAPHAG